MPEYIERESFLDFRRDTYCKNCNRRKGMKKGKLKFVYEIGDVPCRACDIDDVLNDVEDFPAADVVPRSLYEQACAVRDIAVEQLRQIGKDVGDSMDDVIVYQNEDAKRFFGRCPYTDEPCKDWNCEDCGVEQEETEMMREWGE